VGRGLILVPTRREHDLVFAGGAPANVAICGFGLAEAGAGAAHAIALQPAAAARGVVLLGAAGTYDPARAPVGSALVAGSVACDGIGAGGRTPAELGFGTADVLPLPADGPELVSVAAASADAEAAAAVAARHPAAVAEEMEGYAVALAARRFGVPLTILRGISNRAGDRDPTGWRLREALQAAAARLPELLS
jgi:futalosine hydrolase